MSPALSLSSSLKPPVRGRPGQGLEPGKVGVRGSGRSGFPSSLRGADALPASLHPRGELSPHLPSWLQEETTSSIL